MTSLHHQPSRRTTQTDDLNVPDLFCLPRCLGRLWRDVATAGTCSSPERDRLKMEVLGSEYEEVRKKSLRDFHKTHLSGSSIATKPTLSAAIIKPSITNEVTDNEDKLNSEHETDDNESSFESNKKEDDEKIEDDEEEEEEEEEIVKTPSNNSDDDDETKIADKV
ncbi:hypothetical protein Tco_0451726 [Tanacetum coccineum]